ncbi:Signal transduction histidine kinase [Geodermatophilus dictyosporus]|uniref:histidine kinase n=1 Tax=Geodermatophilus dictyosporus TaxID=1523247 RepID=A0A1I5RFK9_9ACTN|nr:histidine kinase [Geodermatophilus dictyosporus]SFP57313.1 Signal transduction histidine kinase [Geodermatophilus dictyosporus]
MPGGRQRGLGARWRALPVGTRDLVCAVVLGAVVQVELVARRSLLEGPPLLQHLTLAVICAAVSLRRVHPVVAAAVAGAGMGVTAALGTAPSAVVYLVYLLMTCSVAWYAPSRGAAALGLAALVLPDAVLYPLTQPEGRVLADVVVNAGVPVTLWVLARVACEQLDRAVRAEREVAVERLRSLEERTRRAEAVATERRRIARECHDVIGHGITLMLLYAEGAQARLGEREPAVSEALDVVTAAGRTALTDVRQVLEVLRADGDQETVGGGLENVPDLVQQVRAAGTRVECLLADVPSRLPATVSTTGYRVVQEALTNALRHAPGGLVQVSLRAADDVVHVEVTDEGGTPGAPAGTGGFGLVGLRERVSLVGGQLVAGPRTDRSGWQVRATLPVGSP